jgi:SAM-dependent methyltransferase
MRSVLQRAKRLPRRALNARRREPDHPELVVTDEDRRYLTTPYDASVPLPRGAERELSPSNPRLRALRETYAGLDIAPLNGSRWNAAAVQSFLDPSYFRGDTLITWHYRELPRATMLKYFVYATYVRGRDPEGLLEKLGEDGAFGCWTFSYPGHPVYSRDLLESVNEIYFLERELKLSARPGFSVLDIGAGYGRLAHRMVQAFPQLDDYCCVDGVAESTFLSEYYLGYRQCTPPARVIPLHEIEAKLQPGTFDLAVNIHSFPECTFEAVAWWVELLQRLAVPDVLIVPNEPDQLLSLEADGSRRDFTPLLEAAGYRLVRREPVVEDPAVRELVRMHDQFHLFSLRSC